MARTRPPNATLSATSRRSTSNGTDEGAPCRRRPHQLRVLLLVGYDAAGLPASCNGLVRATQVHDAVPVGWAAPWWSPAPFPMLQTRAGGWRCDAR